MSKWLLFFAFLTAGCRLSSPPKQKDLPVFTAQACTDQGGEILNPLDGSNCSSKSLLGSVSGMRCPCICCRRN